MRTGFFSDRAALGKPARRIPTGPLPKPSLRTITAKKFDGGWNVVDNELALTSSYARVMRNVYRESSGTISVRYGTELLVDILTAGMSDIVGIEYFATYIAAVDVTGKVCLIEGDGTISVVWDSAIAAGRASPPWSATKYVTFAQMKNQLVIVNGINKPLSIQANKTCNYLVDLGTLQNTRVPVCKYVLAHQRYLIMAGDPNFPDRLYIGSRDTVGTFFGDPPPNDALNIDLATYIQGDSTITGLGVFREFLVITFPNACIIATLGIYSGSQHTPRIDDPLQEIGSVAHKSLAFLGDDLFMLDISGVQSLNRVFVTNKLQPTQMSDLIQPELIKAVSQVPLFTDDATTPFGIYHHNRGMYFLFIPNSADDETVTETVCFNLTFGDGRKLKAWAEFRGWNWSATCKSLLHDLFFARGTEIFRFGSDENPVYGDYIGSEETWDDETAFTDNHGFYPVADPSMDNGIPIDFVWELPWADLNARMVKKNLHFSQIDTNGEGVFDYKVFVDNIYEALDFGEEWQDGFMFDDNLGWEREDDILDPLITMNFVGADVKGYGLAPYGSSPYGGGRSTADERLYETPASGKLHKLRFEGSTNKGLSFKSISLAYSRGTVGR